jgi:hypothetical protein
MGLKMIFRFITFLCLIIITGCKDGGSGIGRNITGKAGELVVVITDTYWEGEPGEQIRDNLAQEHVALPQDEPLFDLINVPPEAFKSIFKTTRNILQVKISTVNDSTGVIMNKDVWASPQSVVIIQARNAEEFKKLFNEGKDKIMGFFLQAEKDRLKMNYDKYYEKAVYNVLDRDFNFTMNVPPGFQIASQKKDFIWLRYETPDISQGIIIYTFPYVSDSTFTVNYLVHVRDSVLKENIPGPAEGSYMVTEKRIDQTFNIREHNGNYASEMRGLWRLVNDYMGGPYISLAELDAANQRVIVAFGYVYAPSKDKRNYLRQVEAMIYSLKLKNQAENDKINSQIKMGN